jgi:hypothetical protein
MRTFLDFVRFEVFLRIVLRLLVTSNVIPSTPIFVTLIMVAIRYSETSDLTRATRRHIPEDGIVHFPMPFQPSLPK